MPSAVAEQLDRLYVDARDPAPLDRPAREAPPLMRVEAVAVGFILLTLAARFVLRAYEHGGFLDWGFALSFAYVAWQVCPVLWRHRG